MDVERVQKINNLALELMKQGLAQDRDEAIKQAEVILAKGDNSLNESLQGGADKMESQGIDRLDLDTGEIRAEKSEELSNGQIRKILERNTYFTVKKMKEYQDKIDGLKKELVELRKELSEIKYNVSNISREQPLKEAVKEKPQKKLETANKGDSSKDHPRSGNYANEEVSIEKFFYSGSGSK